MKISNETIAVLQNFATINNGLQVKAGNVLQTISPGKTVVASAVVAETFEDFCVYDLSQFLGTMSLFNEPELKFGSAWMTIKDGNSTVKYVYADPNTIVTVPERELEIDADIKVIIKKENLQTNFATSSEFPRASYISDSGLIASPHDSAVFLFCPIRRMRVVAGENLER